MGSHEVPLKTPMTRAWFRSCLHRRALASLSPERAAEVEALMRIREYASGEAPAVWLTVSECRVALEACEPRADAGLDLLVFFARLQARYGRTAVLEALRHGASG